jgi:hypothetical protein
VNQSSDKDLTVAGVALRFGIVALALGTAYIHSTLGGLLFTLNAVGYASFAIAMIVPISLAVQYRWLILLITIPPLIMFLFFNRRIVAGMTAGAVKG